MLTRYIRAALVAARHFSIEAGGSSGSAGDSLSRRLLAVVAARHFSIEAGGSSGSAGESLSRRLLGLVYPKRSAVVTIRQWIEEGHKVQKYQLNRIVRELRRHKRYKHALEVCEWMTLQEDINLLPGDYAVHLDLIAKVRGLKSAEKFFLDLPDEMRDHTTCSALLHTYVKNKLSINAEALMKKMSECGFLKSPLPYNHLMTLYGSNGQYEKVPEMIRELKRNTDPDIVTYNLWLSACASQNDVEAAERVFLELRKAHLDPDWVTYSALTNLYIKKELHEKAAFTIKEMVKMASKKNRAAYASVLSLYANMGDKDGVNCMWEKMKSCFNKMNDDEYTCMMSSLIKFNNIEEAESLYAEWESVSQTGDFRIPNILLAAYINRNQMKMAERLQNRMEQKGIKPNYTTWELLTRGYLREEQSEKVLDCFRKAVSSVKRWAPNEKLVGELFKLFEEQGNSEGAEELLVILRNAHFLNTEIYNSLLRTYAKAGRKPLMVVERMKEDNVKVNKETLKLIKVTKRMHASDVAVSFCSAEEK